MSLKVTLSHPFGSSITSNSHSSSVGSTSAGLNTHQMSVLHKSKRLHNEAYYGKDSPRSFQPDIFIPSDSQKLAKFFPFLDHKVTTLFN